MSDLLFGIFKTESGEFCLGQWTLSYSSYEFQGYCVTYRGFTFSRKNVKVEDLNGVHAISKQDLDAFHALSRDLCRYISCIFDKVQGQHGLDNALIAKSYSGFCMHNDAKYLLDNENNQNNYHEEGILCYKDFDEIISINFNPNPLKDHYWNHLREGYLKLITYTTYDLILSFFEDRYKQIYKFVQQLY